MMNDEQRKQFRNHWDKYFSHLKYYPYYIHCSCPLRDKIEVKTSHKKEGIPKYNPGHMNIKNLSPKEAKRKNYWLRHYKDLEYYPWPKIHCHCSCNGKISVKPGHFLTGIPKYCDNHQMKDSKVSTKCANSIKKYYIAHPGIKSGTNSPLWNVPRSAEAKLALSIAHQGKYISDLQLELNRFRKGKLIENEFVYFRSFRDFVKLSCLLWQDEKPIQYMKASRFIREVLKENGLEKFDIIVFINFFQGATQWQLSKHYGIDTSEVKQRLKNVEKKFPEAFLKGPCPTDIEFMPRWEWEDGCERDIRKRF